MRLAARFSTGFSVNDTRSASASPSRVRAYAELFRLPNVFTAIADVLAGFLFTHEHLRPVGALALLIGASSLLYTAGMILNDVFDVEVDRQQRPHRPLPSGRVSFASALALGFGFLAAGVLLGWAASAAVGGWRSGLVATLLAAAVLAYDGPLKRTPIAPVAMGACRAMNVLLGMSAGGPWLAIHWTVAVGMGIYVLGVTWFARTEAAESNRGTLSMAALTIGAGMAVVASLTRFAPADALDVSYPASALAIGGRWFLLWSVFGCLILWRCALAVVDPQPRRVQAAVKHAILSLVMINAVVCFAARDIFWATVVLLLVAPAMLLGRWLYST